MRITAKVFQAGRRQAIRLPAAFRLDAKEFFITKDAETGNIILSRKPDWAEFLRELNALGGVPENFLADRDKSLPQERSQIVGPR